MLNKQTSYPKEQINILFLENISDKAVQIFSTSGYVNIKKIGGSLSEEALIKEIKGVHLLGIRSKTQVTERVLQAATKLQAIGCFCIGVNQVDLLTSRKMGVAVFNAPYSNTRSVAELVIGASIILIRKILSKNAAAHNGLWMKEATGAFEIRGKTLGIIGYGNIGSQVSILAEACGMKVIYYDTTIKLPLGNAQAERSLSDLVAKSDIVTLHVPETAATKNLIDSSLLKIFKKSSILINFARGEVVEISALADALNRGAISGAALDVFPEEPEKNGDRFISPLQNISNVLLTPHIGGSTEEAQVNIGLDVSLKLLKYLESGDTSGSHTVPELNLTPLEGAHRILHIHRNIPGVLSEINTKLSEKKINILAQFLKTNDEIGYVVLDIDKKLSNEAAKLLRDVKATISVRMLY